MNIKLRAVLFFVIYAACAGWVSAQVGLPSIEKQFAGYQEKNLQEKIFVHTDKSFYLAGEIVWFKIYNVDGKSHKPLDISKVAYLEILDKENNAIIQTKVRLKEGSGDGSVYLPVSVAPGNYILRAYTRWMKNFDPEFYFEKPVTIINSLKESEPLVAGAAEANNYDVSFFPEGGNLVAEIKSRIAFRGTDENGKGFQVEGTVIDQNNQAVASFKSLKFGIGSFYLTPEAGKYTAVVNLPDGRVIKKELPQVFVMGYTMHLAHSSGSDSIKITVQNSSPINTSVHLFLHTRNEKKALQTIQMRNGKAEFLVKKDQIGEGITSFTVFNDNRQPVCERLYFKRPEQKAVVKANTNATAYSSRKKVSLEIDVQDLKNQTVASDLSVSVFRLDSLHTVDQTNILSYLWLTSDLKGTVEFPDYYLSATSEEVDEATDNLMLTHGWRRFKWEKIFQNEPPSHELIPEYTGHIVSGKIVNTLTGQPAGNKMSYLTIAGKIVEFYASESDPHGNVNFHTRNFFGAGELLTQPGRTDSNLRVSVLSPFSSKFSSRRTPAFNPYNSRLYNQILTNSVNVQVHNIFWDDAIKRFTSPVTDSSAFYGPVSKTYLLDNYTRFTTMEEVLREYVIEAALSVSKDQYELKLMKPELVTFLENPLILLDGVPVFNTNHIITYDPLKVKAIDVINREYLWGSAFLNGIISFRTYQGSSPALPVSSSVTAMDYDGLQMDREFYSPVYDTENQRGSRIPDFRDLLYWSPDIKTLAGKADQVSFYTSDQTGNYAVVIQGITNGGKPVGKVLYFDVKNPL